MHDNSSANGGGVRKRGRVKVIPETFGVSVILDINIVDRMFTNVVRQSCQWSFLYVLPEVTATGVHVAPYSTI